MTSPLSAPPLTASLPRHTSLPRQLLKWIQGLDLSYSVKDFRKDLKNGFLIAQIISRHRPAKIQMHSFDNSQNSERKRNNWNLISLFLNKHYDELKISPTQYNRIEHGDSEQLYEFMCRLYTVLTERKLSLQQLEGGGNVQTIRNDNLTSSFLMRSDGGMEKLEGGSGNMQEEDEREEMLLQKEIQNNNQTKKPNLLKIPSKQITPTVENSDNNVNMKSVNIRQVNEKTTSEPNPTNNNPSISNKKHPQKLHETSPQQYPQQEQQHSVLNYINDLIESNLQSSPYHSDKPLFDPKYSPCANFIRKIPHLNPEMVCLLFQQIIASKEGLTTKIFKYEQEVWKFYVFLKECLHNIDVAHPGLPVLIDLFFEYIYENEYLTGEFLKQYLYPMLIKEIKLTANTLKRSKIIKLLSRITKQQPSRKELIQYFHAAANNILLFMEFLSILIQQQTFDDPTTTTTTTTTTATTKPLLDIYINYANLYLFSNCKPLKSYALKIYMKICSENFVFGLKTFKPHYDSLHKIEDEQNISQIILILGILLSRITESKEYMNLIKQPTLLSRTYNPENEKMANQMKEEINNISNVIYLCSAHTSDVVKKVALNVIVPLMDIHPVFARVFLEIYLGKTKEEQMEILNAGGVGQEGTDTIEIVKDSKTQLEVRNIGKDELTRVGVDIVAGVNEYCREQTQQNGKIDDSVWSLVSLGIDSLADKEVRNSYPEDKLQKVFTELFSTLLTTHSSRPTTPNPSFPRFIQKLNNHFFNKEIKIKKHHQVFTDFIVHSIAKPHWNEQLTSYFKVLGAEYSRTFNPVIREFVEYFKAEIVNAKDSRLNELVKAVNVEAREN